MKTALIALAFAGMLLLAMPSSGENYLWFTDLESSLPFPGDLQCFPNFGTDGIFGPVRTNDCFIFCGPPPLGPGHIYINCDSTTWPFSDPIPDNVHYDAPRLPFPDQLTYIRERAQSEGVWLDVPGHEWYCSISGSQARFYHFPESIELDTADYAPVTVTLAPSVVVFVNGRVDIRGVLNSHNCSLILGASRDIRLIDDVKLEGTDGIHGTLPQNATSRIVLASEGNIIIGNTLQNGREGCGGQYGFYERCHIVITALLYALNGSFQFEQMNDVDDWYISPVAPDERGNVVLVGGVTQRSRGYLHRSNLGGTGYNKLFIYDERMRYFNPGVFGPFVDEQIPDSFFFDDTPAGATVWDTVVVVGDGPFSGALASYPYFTDTPYQFSGPAFNVRVSFTPPSVGPFYGTLGFYLNGQYRVVRLIGNGISSGAPQVVSSAVFPNPFNSAATLRFSLPSSARVKATVFDILGREVVRVVDDEFVAGTHAVGIQGDSWASGVYFLRFETLGQIETRKLLLIK